MKKIILDTNFLMVPLQFRVDIFSEFNRICDFNYRLYIFERTIDELRTIVEKQPAKHKKAAQFGLKLIKLKNIGLLKSGQSGVDNDILEYAGKDVIIATQDAELKRELREKNIPIIILRQKKYLQLVEGKLYK